MSGLDFGFQSVMEGEMGRRQLVCVGGGWGRPSSRDLDFCKQIIWPKMQSLCGSGGGGGVVGVSGKDSFIDYFLSARSFIFVI